MMRETEDIFSDGKMDLNFKIIEKKFKRNFIFIACS